MTDPNAHVMTDFHTGLNVLPYGDQGVLIECADLKTALSLRVWLQDHPVAGQLEIVPAARTVLIRVDALADPQLVVSQLPSAVELEHYVPTGLANREIFIPVIYDGPDLEVVADLTGLNPAEVVRAHTQTPWVVAFTGFAPGFGYLTGGDERLNVPRRRDPRPKVPPGSVGLAGEFSGIYPRSSPGGWQLIGRTSVVLWDEYRDPPALLAPGTTVRFTQVQP